MKKIFTLLMIFGLILMTGCGGEQKSDSKEIKLGMITHLNATEQKLIETYSGLIKKSGLKLTIVAIKSYNSLNQIQMGLQAGEVDEISLYNCVANYMIANSDKYQLEPNFNPLERIDSFCFAVRKDDTQLKADLDKTIDAMKADGTLDKLVSEYISNVKADKIPAVEIPTFEGAETIKVGVTGDLPPLDFITADGKPSGFNTAILAEIAKRLNKNIQLVQIESGARAAALSANQIDVIFWAVIPLGNGIPSDIDKPEGVEFSAPYFQDNVAHLTLKK